MEKHGKESHETSGLGIACAGASSLGLDLRGTSIHPGTLSCAGTQRNTKMKKLMIAASAALCATVGLCIESANVVGYQTKDVRKNISQQVCTFDAVGGGGLELVKLIPVDGEGDYVGDGDINIQFKTPLGILDYSYAYYGKDEYDDDCAAGWYNEMTDELITDFVFDPGEGFQVYASTACNFQYSGEVNMAETDIPFGKNISMQGNIRPTTTNIQGIIPVDGEGDYIGDGDINIQFASALGILQVSYAYYGEDEYDDDTPAGWYDEMEDELADYTFGAGEGFKVYAAKAGYLRFPEL